MHDPEEKIPFAAVPDVLPRRNGKKIHISTIHRWAIVGCKGVKLKFVQVGGTRCVRRRDLNEFFDRLTALSTGEPTPTAAQSPAARRREIERANQELDDMGV
jgi:hypothetical protein